MDEYRARKIARRSGFVGLSYRGKTLVEAHEWRRRRDRGKRRTTFGVYGTENEIRQAFGKCVDLNSSPFVWNKFRNGKFMVW